jgi:gamma-D-glutamyl-L-lysine dipeptidyl-peptidase
MLLLALALLQPAPPGATVLRPVANMYSSASEDVDVVSQAIYGVPVQIVDEKPGWVKIRTPDEYTGWMPLTSVRKLTDGDRQYASAGRVAQVDSPFAHLYREASVTRHQPLLTVPYETRLEVVAEPEAEDRQWIQVRLVDDRAAWVHRGDITFDPRVLTIGEAIALGERFLGAPYTWGGVSTFGFDCSGLTQMLCRRMGKSLPRDAQPQADWNGVAPVSKDDLRPGDLLYFGSSDKKITHTGMYIGEGRFLHATEHERPMVQISRLEDPHWTERLVACRRLK